MAGQLADGFFDRKPPPPPKGGPLDFSRWSSAPLSKPIPVVYGTAWVEGVPLYVDKANLGFISEWQDVLGVPSIKGYTSGTYAQAQIAFCQGPVTSIDYVRRDKVVHHAGATGGGRFNFKHLSAADDASGATFSYQPTFTLGDASTAALWSALSAETNPFRRLAYGHLAMMRCERLAFIGGRIPSLFARVRGKLANYADPGILSESTEMGAAQTVYNALPGDVIKDVLTSALWGVGLPTGSVVTDVGADGSANSSFDRYCHARGWYIGLALTSAQSAFDVVKMILAATDSTIAVSGSTWKVIPYGDTTVGPRSGYTYTPPSVSIGIVDDDLVQASPDQDPVELDQVGEEDTRNSYPITYVPGYGWGEDEAPAESMDVASVSTTQLRRASPRSLPCIRSGIYAQQISALMAARSVYNRTTARFSLNWRHPEVEPGDFISLTHEKLGFTAKTFRALSTEEGKDGATEIEAVEWNTGVSVVPVYNPQTADGLSYSPTSGGDPAMWEAMAALAAAATAQETADGEIATYWQATAPASASYGDIWFDTDAGNAIYTWRDTGWVSTPNSGVGKAILAAATAQGTADGKARIYYQAAQPTGLGAGDQGDLWVDTDDNLKVWAWTGSAWVLAQDWYTANATANAAADRLTALGDDGIISKEEKQAFFGYVQPFRAMRDEMATAGVYTALGSTAAAALVAQFDEFKTFIHDYCGFEWDWTNPPPLDPGSQLSAIAWWSIHDTSMSPKVGVDFRTAVGRAQAAYGSMRTQMLTAGALRTLMAPTGTPSSTTFLRGDGQWATPGGGGTVTSVTGTSPIASSGGATPAISISAATSGAAGSMSAADKAKLDAATSAATASVIAMRDASGWLYAVDVSTSSDRRTKRKVRNLRGALARVLGLRGVSFYRRGDKTKAARIGLIAQEAREVVPEVVVEDADGMLSVSYGSLAALLVEALREIVKRLDRLEARK